MGNRSTPARQFAQWEGDRRPNNSFCPLEGSIASYFPVSRYLNRLNVCVVVFFPFPFLLNCHSDFIQNAIFVAVKPIRALNQELKFIYSSPS